MITTLGTQEDTSRFRVMLKRCGAWATIRHMQNLGFSPELVIYILFRRKK